ncbi:hypothetical protein O181_040869 [Austropuccinia psidii MF-1]|uniref:Integrase catalytic domain-containing protein n=1 Tax=Austropuccinia psidii MF-1 TaxID=1389203 RepID=A0A9Q3DD50_9BASI|nr:hypothetical protein [Austropuccinia psidii MF-1]
MKVVDQSSNNLLLKECNNIPFSGHLSEDRKREKIKPCIWWLIWKKRVAEYYKSCERCQKANKYTRKILRIMIKIQEPSRPWEIFHVDRVTGLPPGGHSGNNALLVIIDRFSKTQIFLPCQKDDTGIDKVLLIWNRVVSWTGLFTKTISDRDFRFTSALCKSINQFFGTKLNFYTAYHPQTESLSERIIQTLEEMVRRVCAYCLELKYFDGFTHDWCNILLALELEYKTSVYSSTKKLLLF